MFIREFKNSRWATTKNVQCFHSLFLHSDYIWIEPVTGTEFDVAIGARVTSAEGRRIQVKDDDGAEQWLLPERRIKAMHASSVQGVEDMISLGDLHEAGILRNLLIRYNDNLII
jgi:myosin VIIa